MSTTILLFFLFLSCFAVGGASLPPLNLFSSFSTESSSHVSAGRTFQYFRNTILHAEVQPGARQLPGEHRVQPGALQTAHFLETRSIPLYSLLTSLPQIRPVSDDRLANASPGGLTFDSCQNTSECKGIRRCLDITFFPDTTFCGGGDGCFCLPPEPEPCTKNEQCVTGEVCAIQSEFSSAICVSAAVEEGNASFVEVSSENPPEPPAPPLSGLTFDFCQEQEDCLDDRSCSFLENVQEACDSRDPCICLPPELKTCETIDVCPKGEVCVLGSGLDIESVCISQTTVATFPEIFSTPEPLPESPGSGSSGLTLDTCETSADCLGTRRCYQSPPSFGKFCVDADCRCYPVSPAVCQDSTKCETGEICAVETETGSALCVSRNAVDETPGLITNPNGSSGEGENDPAVGSANSPTSTDGPLPEASMSSDETQPGPVSGASGPLSQSPSPTGSARPSSEGDVCIDASALRHLAQDELVFPKHVRARVLCDPDGNCATGSHMVMHRGHGMMMTTYCQKVSCVERMMLVNSPQYRLGMRVASNSKDLQFTAFAARYSSSAEESLLSIATRLGM